MRFKIIYTAVLFYAIATNGAKAQIHIQSKVSKQNLDLDTVIKNYEILELNKAKSFNLEDQIEISLSSELLGEISIAGIKNNVLNDDSYLSMITPSGEVYYPEFPVRTYTAVVKDDASSKVHFTAGGSFFSMIVKKGKRTYSLELVSTLTKDVSDTDYILYNVDDLLDQELNICHRANAMVENTPEEHHAEQLFTEGQKNRMRAVFAEDGRREFFEQNTERPKSTMCKEMEMLIHVDYALYVKYQNNIDMISGEIASVLNLVSNDFQGLGYQGNTLDLNYRIKNLVVSTCQDCDRWGSSGDIVALLTDYMSYTQENAPTGYDLAGLFSGISFNDGIIGLSNLKSTCNNSSNNFVIGVNPGDVTLTRGRCTHEIGHALGCTHNYQFGTSCSSDPGRSNLLMDPWIQRNTDQWSDGTQSCTNNSLATLFDTVDSSTCLKQCGTESCGSIGNLSADMTNHNAISVSWSGGATEYQLVIKKEGDDGTLFQGQISDNGYTYYGLVDLCAPYFISVSPLCDGVLGDATSVVIYSDSRNKTEILNTTVIECRPGSPSTYDLEINIKHAGGDTKGFDIDVDGQRRHFEYSGGAGSIQTVVMNDLVGTDHTFVTILISSSAASSDFCDSAKEIQVPNVRCDIGVVEEFDFCELPAEWSKTTTNSFPYSNPYEWKFADQNREILNYGSGSNANASKTINGSCMAYFDDDINTSPNYSGSISLQSKIFDFTEYQDLSVKFVYNFHSFEDIKGDVNNSYFSFEVFDGYNWQELYRDNQDDCAFTEVWTEPCQTEVNINIAAYNNSFMRVRFNYSDGNAGAWAGMIALDEFEIVGARGAVLPVLVENFEATHEAHEIMLEWQSFDEEHVAHYRIEKFDVVTQEFQLFLNVSADNRKYTEYHVYDDHPLLGENLYRLTPVSHDNQKMNSKLAAVLWEHEVTDDIAIFPNPVNLDYININTPFEENEYSLLDLNGKVIQRIATNDYSTKFRLDNVLPGTYMLQIKNDTGIKNHKIVRL